MTDEPSSKPGDPDRHHGSSDLLPERYGVIGLTRKRMHMFVANFTTIGVGRLAIATGITGLLAMLFIVLFFSIGQPFGTLNDICIGLTAILSMILVWMMHPRFHSHSPLLSKVLFLIALAGAILVVIGSVLAITRTAGWFLSGLYMAAGNALIGMWLLGLCYSAYRYHALSPGVAIFGLFSGAILLLGLVALPGILRGLDPPEYVANTVNIIWWTSAFGWLVLFPVWNFLLGRSFLNQ